jgi:hypothetical protein
VPQVTESLPYSGEKSTSLLGEVDADSAKMFFNQAANTIHHLYDLASQV